MPCAAVVPRYAGHLTDQPLRISTIQFDGTNIRVAVKPNYFHRNESVVDMMYRDTLALAGAVL